MTFAILVLGAPVSTQSAETALAFARTAVDAGHKIFRIFFFHDGVLNGNSLMDSPAAGDKALPMRWASLAEENDIDLVLCVSSALKRGVADEQQAVRMGRSVAAARAPFALGGLGQWVEACIVADRVLTFGS